MLLRGGINAVQRAINVVFSSSRGSGATDRNPKIVRVFATGSRVLALPREVVVNTEMAEYRETMSIWKRAIAKGPKSHGRMGANSSMHVQTCTAYAICNEPCRLRVIFGNCTLTKAHSEKWRHQSAHQML